MAIDQDDLEEIRTRSEFAARLSAERTRSGRTFRDLGSAVALPPTTISGWTSGKHLPYPRQSGVFRQLMLELGCSPDTADQWVATVQRLRALRNGDGARLSDRPSPYQGLEPFDRDDAAWFYGRQASVERVVARVEATLAAPDPALLVVLGPSGAGKSSLLRAGVARALESTGWAVTIFTPLGERPPITDHRPSGRHMIVVDQFEELFGGSVDATARERLLAEAVNAANSPDTVVVLIARSDFFDRMMTEVALRPALESGPIIIDALTESELRDVITKPAEHAGSSVDPALVERLIRDIAPDIGATNRARAATLPLLSHVLLETWKRSGAEMRLDDYASTGGLRGAVEISAERAFGRLPPEGQAAAERLFIHLVNVDGPDTPITRRRAEIDHLVAAADREHPGSGDDVQRVVDHFAAERLLTIDHGAVELCHEVLITAWPRLQGWVTGRIDDLVTARQLREAARTWRKAGGDHDALLRGARFEAIDAWAQTEAAADLVGSEEQDFLGRSREAQQHRRRRSRRVRVALIGLSVMSLLLAGAATVNAVAAARAGERARTDRDAARSREIALQADQVAATDASLAAQLAAVAYDISPTLQARSALMDATARRTPLRFTGGEGLVTVATSSNGAWFAYANLANGSINVFSSADLQQPATVIVGAPEGTSFRALAMSASGELLAASSDTAVMVWRIDGGRAFKIGSVTTTDSSAMSLTFAGSARLLAGMTVGGVRTWEVGDTLTEGVPIAMGSAVTGLVADADGRSVVTGGDDGVVRRWAIDAGQAAQVGSAASKEGDQVHTVARTGDGGLVAAGYRSGTVQVFDTSGGGLEPIDGPVTEFGTWVNAVAFSFDGEQLAVGSSDQSVVAWNVADWSPAYQLDHAAPVTGVVAVGQQRMAVATNDGAVNVWPTAGWPLRGADDTVFSVGYSTAGDLAAVFPGSDDGTVQLWDTSVPTAPVRLAPIPMPEAAGAPSGAGAISPDGTVIAAGSATGPVQLWNVAVDGTATPAGAPLTASQQLIENVAFSADGALLAVASDDHNVYVWDVGDTSSPKLLATLTEPENYVYSVAFSPDSRFLAAASVDQNVYLWQVEHPSAPVQVAVLEGFESYAQSVAFTDSSDILAAGGADGTVRAWDLTGSVPTSLGPELKGPAGYVMALDFQPKTRVLAAAVTDGTVWLWDFDDPDQPVGTAVLRAPEATMFTVGFSPDGTRLLGAGSDRHVFGWDVDPADALGSVCASSGASITADEWETYLGELPYADPCEA